MQFRQLRKWLKNICNTSVYYIERNSKYGFPVENLSKRLSKFIYRPDFYDNMNENFMSNSPLQFLDL